MDQSTVVVVVILVVLVVIGMLAYRQRGKFKFTAPGTSVEFEGSNERTAPSPAVKVAKATSRRGGLEARDATGRGADVSEIEVDRDIHVSSASPEKARMADDPKA